MLRPGTETPGWRCSGALASVAGTAGLLLLMAPAGCMTLQDDYVEPPACPERDLSCTGCHGDPDTGNPAPPRDTTDGTDPTSITVGAHTAHLSPSAWRASIACSECHSVPDQVNQAGHIGGGAGEVTWGPLARSGGAAPTWNRDKASCAGTYCHGSTLLGPSARGTVYNTPEWTSTDGRFCTCGESCHTNPPGGDHPASTACEQCHGSVIGCYNPETPSATQWVAAKHHINGVVDVNGFGCVTCHQRHAVDAPAAPVATRTATQPNP